MTCGRASPTIRRPGPARASWASTSGRQFQAQAPFACGRQPAGWKRGKRSVPCRPWRTGSTAIRRPTLPCRARGELRTYPGRIVRPDASWQTCKPIWRGAESSARQPIRTRTAKSATFSTGRPCAGRWSSAASAPARTAGATCARSNASCCNRKLAMAENLSLVTAISKSTLRRDANGNPGLDKATGLGRIDVLSAAVIACGLAEPRFDRPERRRRVRVHVVQ